MKLGTCVRSNPSPAHPGSTGGFTLLEMLLALSVFALLCGALMGVVLATLRTSGTIAQEQEHRRQWQALTIYLQDKLARPSYASQVRSWPLPGRDDSEGTGIIITDPPRTFVLATFPRPEGGWQVRVAEYSDPASQDPGFVGSNRELPWVTIIPRVESLAFRFQMPGIAASVGWKEQWTDPTHRPGVIEMSGRLEGEEASSTADFWIPPLAPPFREVEDQVFQ